MIGIIWLIPAAMFGALCGALIVGICNLASEDDDRQERRRKK